MDTLDLVSGPISAYLLPYPALGPPDSDFQTAQVREFASGFRYHPQESRMVVGEVPDFLGNIPTAYLPYGTPGIGWLVLLYFLK